MAVQPSGNRVLTLVGREEDRRDMEAELTTAAQEARRLNGLHLGVAVVGNANFAIAATYVAATGLLPPQGILHTLNLDERALAEQLQQHLQGPVDVLVTASRPMDYVGAWALTALSRLGDRELVLLSLDLPPLPNDGCVRFTANATNPHASAHRYAFVVKRQLLTTRAPVISTPALHLRAPDPVPAH